MSKEQSLKLATWLAKEQLTIEELSKFNPAEAANYAKAQFELLQGFFSVPVSARHVFIKL